MNVEIRESATTFNKLVVVLKSGKGMGTAAVVESLLNLGGVQVLGYTLRNAVQVFAVELPNAARADVWLALQAHMPGAEGTGPRGAFKVPTVEGARLSLALREAQAVKAAQAKAQADAARARALLIEAQESERESYKDALSAAETTCGGCENCDGENLCLPRTCCGQYPVNCDCDQHDAEAAADYANEVARDAAKVAMETRTGR